MPVKQVLRLALIGLLGAAYLWLGHLASISADPPLLSILIGLAPLSVSAVLLAVHSRSAWLIALCAAGLLGMLVYIDFLRANMAWVYFIQHAGMHTMLGLMFGRTLSRDRTVALCSQISCFVYSKETLDAKFFDYAWAVTVMWTIYFAFTTALSTLLFFFGPLSVWSVYANLLTPVIIGLLFVVEYAIRIRVLPNRQHAGIAGSIRAYREFSQQRQAKLPH
ncbi:hypothetical protein Q9Q94_06860 [Uliginosibacterium sp. 31-16]|uniref:hypothetical protein n=1 Tax=Uliginosibacterium sp. 31-16 TaxID=3068315 RepID=UPI00273F01E2|nr:hypothetical protein [Uliginosibacterium sp. 31-16]MDP5239242.1 hypothetical protein [Uliginosibacterium sp. 31-16]